MVKLKNGTRTCNCKIVEADQSLGPDYEREILHLLDGQDNPVSQISYVRDQGLGHKEEDHIAVGPRNGCLDCGIQVRDSLRGAVQVHPVQSVTSSQFFMQINTD